MERNSAQAAVVVEGRTSGSLFGRSLLGACLSIGMVAILQPLGTYAESPAGSVAQAADNLGTLPAPIKEVRATLDDVIAAVEQFKGEAHLAERREKLRSVIKPRFDFDEMARRSLGPEWSKRTASEQEEFVSVFSELLASTYLARVETVTSDMVSVDKEKVEMPSVPGDIAKAIVRTTVTNKGDTFPIDYRLQFVKGNWRVYDVIIENIGLVANYRNEFAGIIRREEFSGLMEKLRAKAGRSA
jgi:phospholipid transport system substrate-binding protein